MTSTTSAAIGNGLDEDDPTRSEPVVARPVHVAIYARVIDASEQSLRRLARKVEHLRAAVVQFPEWTVARRVVDIGNGRRINPGLRQLLEDAAIQPIHLVIVGRISELASSPRMLWDVLTRFDAAGISLHVLNTSTVGDAPDQRAALDEMS